MTGGVAAHSHEFTESRDGCGAVLYIIVGNQHAIQVDGTEGHASCQLYSFRQQRVLAQQKHHQTIERAYMTFICNQTERKQMHLG